MILSVYNTYYVCLLKSKHAGLKHMLQRPRFFSFASHGIFIQDSIYGFSRPPINLSHTIFLGEILQFSHAKSYHLRIR